MIISEQKRKVESPRSLANILSSILSTENEIDQSKEHFWCIGLNVKNVVQYVDLVTLGTLDCSLVHPREVFRLAIHRGISCLVLGHNHPSGDPYPSQEDITVTRKLQDGGNLLGIKVLDHVIIGNNTQDFYSFAEHGRM